MRDTWPADSPLAKPASAARHELAPPSRDVGLRSSHDQLYARFVMERYETADSAWGPWWVSLLSRLTCA